MLLHYQNLSSIHVQLLFKNNSVDAAGSVLYGGALDNCKLTGLHSYSSGEVFDSYFTTMTLITTQLQVFPLTPFTYAYVKITFQTVVKLGMALLYSLSR